MRTLLFRSLVSFMSLSLGCVTSADDPDVDDPAEISAELLSDPGTIFTPFHCTLEPAISLPSLHPWEGRWYDDDGRLVAEVSHVVVTDTTT